MGWYYDMDNLHLAVARGLEQTTGEAMRWLVEGLRHLRAALEDDVLEQHVQAPSPAIVQALPYRWQVLVAAATRHRLRTLGFTTTGMPEWTHGLQPLETLWFPGAYTPRPVARAFNDTPVELWRLGIMVPTTSLDYDGATTTMPSQTPLPGDRDHEFGRDTIIGLLTDLGAELQSSGLHTRITVVGGAAIALTLNDRRLTADIDALVADHPSELRRAAAAVAKRHGVPRTWIGDDVSEYMASRPLGREEVIDLPGITVAVASPEHLLGMKVRSAIMRGSAKDDADIATLAEHLGLERPLQIAQLTQRQFGGMYQDDHSLEEYVETARDALTATALETQAPSPQREQMLARLWSKDEDETEDHDYEPW